MIIIRRTNKIRIYALFICVAFVIAASAAIRVNAEFAIFSDRVNNYDIARGGAENRQFSSTNANVSKIRQNSSRRSDLKSSEIALANLDENNYYEIRGSQTDSYTDLRLADAISDADWGDYTLQNTTVSISNLRDTANSSALRSTVDFRNYTAAWNYSQQIGNYTYPSRASWTWFGANASGWYSNLSAQNDWLAPAFNRRLIIDYNHRSWLQSRGGIYDVWIDFSNYDDALNNSFFVADAAGNEIPSAVWNRSWAGPGIVRSATVSLKPPTAPGPGNSLFHLYFSSDTADLGEYSAPAVNSRSGKQITTADGSVITFHSTKPVIDTITKGGDTVLDHSSSDTNYWMATGAMRYYTGSVLYQSATDAQDIAYEWSDGPLFTLLNLSYKLGDVAGGNYFIINQWWRFWDNWTAVWINATAVGAPTVDPASNRLNGLGFAVTRKYTSSSFTRWLESGETAITAGYVYSYDQYAMAFWNDTASYASVIAFGQNELHYHGVHSTYGLHYWAQAVPYLKTFSDGERANISVAFGWASAKNARFNGSLDSALAQLSFVNPTNLSGWFDSVTYEPRATGSLTNATDGTVWTASAATNAAVEIWRRLEAPAGFSSTVIRIAYSFVSNVSAYIKINGTTAGAGSGAELWRTAEIGDAYGASAVNVSFFIYPAAAGTDYQFTLKLIYIVRSANERTGIAESVTTPVTRAYKSNNISFTGDMSVSYSDPDWNWRNTSNYAYFVPALYSKQILGASYTLPDARAAVGVDFRMHVNDFDAGAAATVDVWINTANGTVSATSNYAGSGGNLIVEEFLPVNGTSTDMKLRWQVTLDVRYDGDGVQAYLPWLHFMYEEAQFGVEGLGNGTSIIPLYSPAPKIFLNKSGSSVFVQLLSDNATTAEYGALNGNEAQWLTVTLSASDGAMWLNKTLNVTTAWTEFNLQNLSQTINSFYINATWYVYSDAPGTVVLFELPNPILRFGVFVQPGEVNMSVNGLPVRDTAVAAGTVSNEWGNAELTFAASLDTLVFDADIDVNVRYRASTEITGPYSLKTFFRTASPIYDPEIYLFGQNASYMQGKTNSTPWTELQHVEVLENGETASKLDAAQLNLILHTPNVLDANETLEIAAVSDRSVIIYRRSSITNYSRVTDPVVDSAVYYNYTWNGPAAYAYKWYYINESESLQSADSGSVDGSLFLNNSDPRAAAFWASAQNVGNLTTKWMSWRGSYTASVTDTDLVDIVTGGAGTEADGRNMTGTTHIYPRYGLPGDGILILANLTQNDPNDAPRVEMYATTNSSGPSYDPDAATLTDTQLQLKNLLITNNMSRFWVIGLSQQYINYLIAQYSDLYNLDPGAFNLTDFLADIVSDQVNLSNFILNSSWAAGTAWNWSSPELETSWFIEPPAEFQSMIFETGYPEVPAELAPFSDLSAPIALDQISISIDEGGNVTRRGYDGTAIRFQIPIVHKSSLSSFRLALYDVWSVTNVHVAAADVNFTHSDNEILVSARSSADRTTDYVIAVYDPIAEVRRVSDEDTLGIYLRINLTRSDGKADGIIYFDNIRLVHPTLTDIKITAQPNGASAAVNQSIAERNEVDLSDLTAQNGSVFVETGVAQITWIEKYGGWLITGGLVAMIVSSYYYKSRNDKKIVKKKSVKNR